MLKFNFSKCITLFVSTNYADRCRLCLFCSAQPSSSCTTPPPHDHNVTTSKQTSELHQTSFTKDYVISTTFKKITELESTTILKMQAKISNSFYFSMKDF